MVIVDSLRMGLYTAYAVAGKEDIENANDLALSLGDFSHRFAGRHISPKKSPA